MNFLLTLPILLAQGYVDPAYAAAQSYCASKAAGRSEQQMINDAANTMVMLGVPRSDNAVQAKRMAYFLHTMCGGW